MSHLTASQVATASTKDLLAFFNANTGGAQVKKFADRKTAEHRVLALIEEITVESEGVHGYETHGLTQCPHCGIHLSNGVGEHLQEVNGTQIRHDEFQFACLACDGEFGPAIPKHSYARKTAGTSTPRPTMVESLKLNRAILDELSGRVYENACQVWKAGLVTAAQGDRLSAVLYGAAKAGDRTAKVTIAGRTFSLAVK